LCTDNNDYAYTFPLATPNVAYFFRLLLVFYRDTAAVTTPAAATTHAPSMTMAGAMTHAPSMTMVGMNTRALTYAETPSSTIFVLSTPKPPTLAGIGRNVLLEWDPPLNHQGRTMNYFIEEKLVSSKSGKRYEM
jgi:hypothetical protein